MSLRSHLALSFGVSRPEADAREKKKRNTYLASLDPEERGTIFDTALAERRGALSAERAGIGAGLDRTVDFSKTGVMSSFAAVALTPSMGFEGAALAAGGIAATSMTSAAYLAAQEAWVNYKSRKLELAGGSAQRAVFVADGTAPRALGIDKLSADDMRSVLQSKAFNAELSAVEQARQKQALARSEMRLTNTPVPEPFDGVISGGGVPEKAVDAVEQARQKQALARAALQQIKPPQPDALAEEPAPESKESAPASRHIVGDNRDFKQFALSAMASGTTLVDNNGKPVIETKNALIAPASPLMSDAKRRERVEAMVDHATQKFPGQPLRLDGNGRFVEMAIEAALARGLTVEVPAKYAELLAKKEKEQSLSQPSPVLSPVPDVDGVISPGVSPQKSVSRTDDTPTSTPARTTGRLVGYSEDVGADGRREITVQRAGQDVAVRMPVSQANPEDLRALVGKPVRYEPETAGHPARLVDLTHAKKQALETNLELQR